MRRRMMMGKRLPYDAEVEYLECNDFGSFIRLDYVPTREKDNTFELKFNIKKMIETGSWNSSLYAGYTNEQSACYRIIKNNNMTNKVRFYHGQKASGDYLKDYYSIVLDKDYSIKISNSNLIINGINETVHSGYRGKINEGAIRLFFNIYAKIFYFKIYEGEHLVREHIPVRKNSVGYMYDKVSGQLFGNAGTGQFILGPDKMGGVIKWLIINTLHGLSNPSLGERRVA